MHILPILDRLVVVNLDVRIWSGRKKLTAEDLALVPTCRPKTWCHSAPSASATRRR